MTTLDPAVLLPGAILGLFALRALRGLKASWLASGAVAFMLTLSVYVGSITANSRADFWDDFGLVAFWVWLAFACYLIWRWVDSMRGKTFGDWVVQLEGRNRNLTVFAKRNALSDFVLLKLQGYTGPEYHRLSVGEASALAVALQRAADKLNGAAA
jgi:hypothetical protein